MTSNNAVLQGEPNTVQIFNRLDQIDFTRIVIIVVAAWALIKLVEWLFPWLAKRVSARLRLFLLPSIAVVRLVILIIAVAMIFPLVVKASLQNLVAILVQCAGCHRDGIDRLWVPVRVRVKDKAGGLPGKLPRHLRLDPHRFFGRLGIHRAIE